MSPATATHNNRYARLLQHPAFAPGLLGIVLLVLYPATMSEHGSLEDSGEFIAAVNALGIVHPPGYPLYSVLGKLFTLIPLDNIAFRVKLLSAVSGALAAVFIYFCALRLSSTRAIAFCCGLFFGVCALPWLQAVTAEVYALHGLLYFALLYLALRLHHDFNRRDLYLWTLLLGLSLSHHWPLTILGGVAFVPLMLGKQPIKRLMFVRARILPLLGLFALGISPYLYLVLVSLSDLEIAFSGPVALSDLPNYVLRSQYASVDANVTASATDTWLMTKYFFASYAQSAGVLGTLAVAAGAALSLLDKNRMVTTALFLGFLSSSVILLLFLNFDYDTLRREAYMTYQIMPCGVAALFVHYALDALRRYIPHPRTALIAGACGMVLCVATFAGNIATSNMRKNTLAFDYASSVLKAMPQNAVLFAHADTDIGSLAYAHGVAGVRPDVRLHSLFGHMFSNRLYLPSTHSLAESQNKLRELLKAEKRVFVMALAGPISKMKGVHIHNHGLFYEVSLSPVKTPISDTLPLAREFLDRHRGDPYQNIWKAHRYSIVNGFCRVILLWNQTHPMLQENPRCKYAHGLHLLRAQRYEDAIPLLRDSIDWANSIYLSKGLRANVYENYTLASVNAINARKVSDEQRLQMFQVLINEVRPAMFILPTCRNPVVRYMLQVHNQVDVNIGYNQIKSSFGICDNLKPLFNAKRRRSGN